jgi:hypothetical protein
MDYYYNYFKSFLKPKAQDTREYYYQYLKSSMKSKTRDNDVIKDRPMKEVLFAKAPEEIKARKRSSESTSTPPAAKKARPREEEKQKLLKKYPALKKL